MAFGVLIVGLGQVGMGYDLDSGNSRLVLTHARSFSLHPDFSILGGVDPDPVRCALFEARYATPAGSDLAAALASTKPDVVVVATPTAHHGTAVTSILEHAAPKLILCEKPLSYDREEARAMVDGCRSRNIHLFVNYQRRVDPAVGEVKRRLDDGAIASPVKGVAWYSKGLVHNGSHFVNLLEYWLGPVRDFRIIDAGGPWRDDDPEPDLMIEFAAGRVTMLSTPDERLSHHEVLLVAPNGCLRYEAGGARITWQAAIPDPSIDGFTTVSTDREELPSEAGRLQRLVPVAISACLNGHATDLCSGAAALKTLEVVLDMKAAL